MLNENTVIHIRKLNMLGFHEVKLDYVINHGDYLQEHSVNFDLAVHAIDHETFTALHGHAVDLVRHALCMMGLIPVETLIEFYELQYHQDYSGYEEARFKMEHYEREVDTTQLIEVKFGEGQEWMQMKIERICSGQSYMITLPKTCLLSDMPIRGAFRYAMLELLRNQTSLLEAAAALIVRDNIHRKHRQLNLFGEDMRSLIKTLKKNRVTVTMSTANG